MEHEIEVQELPDRRLAAVRHVGPYPGIGAAFDRLGDWARAHPDAVVGAPLAVYHDDPEEVPADQLRSDAGVPVTEEVAIGGAPGIGVPGVHEAHLPGGRYAVSRFVGPYAGLPATWPGLMAALAAAGVAADPGRPCFEVYRDEPGTVPAEQLVTLLYAPVG